MVCYLPLLICTVLCFTEIALLLQHVTAVAPETALLLLPLPRAETPAVTAAIVKSIACPSIATLLDKRCYSA